MVGEKLSMPTIIEILLRERDKYGKLKTTRCISRCACGEFGDIYYATVDAKGRMRGNREEVTDDAVLAVMEHMASMASDKKPFDGKAEIEINGFKLTFDATGVERFMNKYGCSITNRKEDFQWLG